LIRKKSEKKSEKSFGRNKNVSIFAVPKQRVIGEKVLIIIKKFFDLLASSIQKTGKNK